MRRCNRRPSNRLEFYTFWYDAGVTSARCFDADRGRFWLYHELSREAVGKEFPREFKAVGGDAVADAARNVPAHGDARCT